MKKILITILILFAIIFVKIVIREVSRVSTENKVKTLVLDPNHNSHNKKLDIEETKVALQKAAERINKTLPTKIDDHFRLDRVKSGPSINLSLFYTITDIPSGLAGGQKLSNKLKAYDLKIVCTNSFSRAMLKEGVTYDMYFNNASGEQLALFSIKENDCNKRETI